MATCAKETGFLFWKKRCDRPSIGACDECRLFTCQIHGGIQGDGGLMCHACLGSEGAGDAASGAGIGSSMLASSFLDSSVSSADSSSGSSDSGGGGDSGGSSSD